MYKKFGKRILDIVVSSLMLLILTPVFIIVSIIIRLKLGKPIIFVQDRPGKNGQIFKMYKFRSMSNTKGENGVLLPNEQRINTFGEKLRGSSLDELPELWNVIIGNMSLVGPRPLRTKYLNLYNNFQKRRHEVKPGITGWAQVNGRNQSTWNERFTNDVWYIDNMSLWLDIKILLLTFVKTLKKEGVMPEQNKFLEPFTGNEE